MENKEHKSSTDPFQVKGRQNGDGISQLDVEQELNQLETELEQLKKANEQLLQKRDQLSHQFNTLKQSPLWRFLRWMRKRQQFVKKLVKALFGQRSLKTLFSRSWKKKNAKKRIKKLKYSLYELGFKKKALTELEEVYETTDNPYLQRMAAWELALWHANQYSVEGAHKCLEFLPASIQGEDHQDHLRKAAILEAECHGRIGDSERAKQLLWQALKVETHVDLYLALANQEAKVSEKMKWINKGLQLYKISEITVEGSGNQSNGSENQSLYDSITGPGGNSDQYRSIQTKDLEDPNPNAPKHPKEPLVTVIIPVYNAEDVLHTSLSSILNQTWSNIEVLVVDDCSSDHTLHVVQRYADQDHRVQVLQTPSNGGPYVARNMALKQARGTFVTVNDADDWSHPQKIERQVRHLLDHEKVIANTSQQARATEDLVFYRRGKPGSYMFANMSSLMFRREPVLEKIGYWDPVRFGADGEFKRRLKKVFGDEAVVDVETGPLSFQRQSKGSLTGHQVFGFHGFFMGARKEYFDSYAHYHQHAENLRYDFQPGTRPFAVPEPMWPQREQKTGGRRHFDVVIASEFRLLGGTNMSNVEEIKAQKQMGLRTGLIQLSRYDFHSEKQINPQVRHWIDGDQVQILVYGEKISCDVLIVRHPPVLQEWQQYVPDVEAQSVVVVVNQPPRRDYSAEGKELYNLQRCVQHVQQYFGKTGTWYPIGPSIREALHEHHEQGLKGIPLAAEDWVNIIDVDEWKRSVRPPRSSKIKIGRHSRSQYVKWPAEREQLLQIYPEADDYEIHVLGGAEAPKKILGALPSNWKVLEFGEVHPRDFLAELDVFVYYTHPDWVEAFGRVIFEAMAVGVPVIIPPSYKHLFGEAAVYAQPHEVQEKIKWLMNDDHYYHSQVEKAQAYVEQHFGYSKHASRLKAHILDKHDYRLH